FFSLAEQNALLAEPYDGTRELLLDIQDVYREGVAAQDIYNKISGVLAVMKPAEDMLVFHDRITLMNGVEARNPFYDAQLMTLTNRIPTHFRGSESKDMHKAALKLAFKDLLPTEIVDRKKRALPPDYFTPNQVRKLRERFFSPQAITRTGLLKPEMVDRTLNKEIRKGPKGRMSNRTWGLLALQIWYEKYMNGVQITGAETNWRSW
ncbi:asparagine synthase C-terminal domain-containing protein, partial [bacterium]|nr:asparagine synthase C-terminal domain-containing protein [bacterium]